MTNSKKIITTTILIVFAIIGLYGMVVLISAGLDKSEVVSCLKLDQQSKTYEGFFLAGWEKEMCEAHGIFINAPVK
jgi:hypothetical protein